MPRSPHGGKGARSLPPSEYDPVGSPGADPEDLLRVRELFSQAARPFVAFPWSWVAWAFVLPAAALLTRPVAGVRGAPGVLLLWSGAVLVGSVVEALGIRRGLAEHGRSALGRWVLRLQGNLSLVALALSVTAVVADQAALLPGIWLLLLGHSFYAVGGLAFPPFRPFGVAWQLAGVLALWPQLIDPLRVLAGITFAGNLWMAWQVWKGGPRRGPRASAHAERA